MIDFSGCNWFNKKGIWLQIPEMVLMGECYAPGGSGGWVSMQQLPSRKENAEVHTFLNLSLSAVILNGFEKRVSCVTILLRFLLGEYCMRQCYCLQIKTLPSGKSEKMYYVKCQAGYAK